MTSEPDFGVPLNSAVVTTSYVTQEGLPILYVSHTADAEAGVVWLFHCGNGDSSARVLQLVGLGEILKLAPELTALADLPCGWHARRDSAQGEWVVEKED